MPTTAPTIPWMARQIELVPRDSLSPAPENAKLHPEEQLQALELIMREVGFTQPLLVQGDGIVAGEGRWLVAGRLELPEVPVVRLDHLTPAQRRAYILADNALARTGYQDDVLREQLRLVAEEQEVALEAVGFTEEELVALEVIEVPEEPAPTVAVRSHDRQQTTPARPPEWRTKAAAIVAAWATAHGANVAAEDIDALLDALLEGTRR